MTPTDLRSLAADHAHLRHNPHEVSAALLAAADWIEHYEKRVADLVGVANAFAAEAAQAAAGERERCASLIERATTKQRAVRAAVNGTLSAGVEPCALAALIRSGRDA